MATLNTQRKRKAWFGANERWALFFLWPIIVGLLVFQLFPILFGLTISFTQWRNFSQPPTFVGFQNYVNIWRDSIPYSFGKAIGNTLFFVGTVPIGMTVSLTLAMLVNQKVKGINIFRTLYFLPMVTAVAAVALVWQAIYQPNFGLANYLLSLIGIKGPRWLGSPQWFKPAIAIMSIWKGSGWGMMIFLAALQNISQEYYDAAEVDGANGWQKFRHITLPLITPQIFFVMVMLISWSFQNFDSVFVMNSSGGPLSSGATIVMYIYENAFNSSNYGLGSAAAYVLFAIIMCVTWIQFQLQKRWVFYES